MPSIVFDKISKSFQDAKVVDGFSAAVDDREFLVLLGPSGCGKSTMLRMVAGLTELSEGSLRFNEAEVAHLTPKQRGIAFVFQSYALYPHMSVEANIAFPLVMDHMKWWHQLPLMGSIARRRLLKSPGIRNSVDKVAKMLELTDYLQRRPKALSGGQRQRVALARALVREPEVYLLDEPLSNLDAKLRTQMRAEISALHSRVKKTFIYVTHDQVEAMTMGTRIIVMNDGVVQQYGTPKEIYDTPANVFVAQFIGSPPMNIVNAQVGERGIVLNGQEVIGSESTASALRQAGYLSIQVGVRAERASIHSIDHASGFKATVVTTEHLGAETIVGVHLGKSDTDALVQKDASGALLIRIPAAENVAPGDICKVNFKASDLAYFDSSTGARIEVIA